MGAFFGGQTSLEKRIKLQKNVNDATKLVTGVKVRSLPSVSIPVNLPEVDFLLRMRQLPVFYVLK